MRRLAVGDCVARIAWGTSERLSDLWSFGAARCGTLARRAGDRALLPQLVPEEHFANAVAWNASVFQGATILGPMVGGLIYAFFRGPSAVYLTAMLLSCWACCLRYESNRRRKRRHRKRRA